MKFLKKHYKIIIVSLVIICIAGVVIIKKVNTKNNNEEKYTKFSTTGNVKEQVHEYKMYEFVSSTCSSCEKMEPIFEKISNEYKEKMDFEVINVNYNYNLSNKYKINVVPTFLIVDKEGNVIKKDIGEMTYEDMSLKIQNVLNKGENSGNS